MARSPSSARASRRSTAPDATRPSAGSRRRCNAASSRSACPTVGGVTLAARYLPGTVGVDVGGDWYDIIQLEDGSHRPRRRRRGRQGRSGRGDDGPAPQRPPRLRLRVRRSAHRRLAARQARRGDDGLGIRDARVSRRRPTAAAGAVRRCGTSAAADPLARRHDVVPRAGALAPDRRRRLARVRGGRGAARAGLDDPALHRRPRRAPRHAARRGAAAARRVGGGERGRPRGARRVRARGADRRQRAPRRHRRPRDPVRGARGRRPPARAAVDPERPRRDARGSSLRGSQRGKVDEGVAAEAVLAVWEACANAVEHAQQPVAVVVQASGDARRRRPDADRGPGQRPVEARGRDRPSAASVWG